MPAVNPENGMYLAVVDARAEKVFGVDRSPVFGTAYTTEHLIEAVQVLRKSNRRNLYPTIDKVAQYVGAKLLGSRTLETHQNTGPITHPEAQLSIPSYVLAATPSFTPGATQVGVIREFSYMELEAFADNDEFSGRRVFAARVLELLRRPEDRQNSENLL